jgi:hypothetical protein
MEALVVSVCGAAGTVAFFAFVSFATWVDYRKKRDEREFAHRERMKALELGHAPLDAEIERAKAYATAARVAGLIGILVPLAVILLTVVGTLIVVLTHVENITIPLLAAWMIAAVLVLVAIVRSLNALRQLPQPTAHTTPAPGTLDKLRNSHSTAFQAKRLEQ